MRKNALVRYAWLCIMGLGGAVVPVMAQGACGLLSPGDITKAAGITVGSAVPGKAIPGTLGKCTWTGGKSRVIVVLTDARHMQITVEAALEGGGTAVSGLGSKAAGMEGAAFTGGGYIVNVLDAKGGFGVSILGPDGNQQRAVALAKLVESRR